MLGAVPVPVSRAWTVAVRGRGSRMSGDTESIRVQLLGPVGAWRGRHELALGGPRQQTVFSMLAMRANRLVSRAELIDGLWGAELPASPVNGLHVYIAGLRQVLEPHRANRAPGQVLRGSGPGYLLQLDPARLDAAELGRLLAPARPGPARNAPAAGQLAALDAALGLWQGIPLAGLPGPWTDIERARLAELRLAATEQRTVLLALGRAGQVVAELTGVVREHPLRERFREQLILALYRCGRQADALAEYAAVRQVLDTELGIAPGPGLRLLQHRILAADAALDWPAGHAARSCDGGQPRRPPGAGQPGHPGRPRRAARPGCRHPAARPYWPGSR